MTFGNSVNEFYAGQIRRVNAKRDERLAAIKTKEDAAKYVAEVRRRIAKIFNFPARTPLDPVVTGRLERPGVVMERLYYHSRPGYPVTANLYLPAQRTGKVPGALVLCGHARDGKAYENYAAAAQGLALKGFAAMIIDPVEQGERRQYASVHNPRWSICDNHNMMGKQMALEGEWLGSWRAWDAVRGLDYLASRPEVDASRLVVTGNSGGGTLTTWVAATDPRPVAVAPSCFVTTWLHDFENELPSDIEQIPPRVLEYGLEMGDLLLAQAPRSVLILGQRNDYFDPRGVERTYHEVKRINGLLGGRTEVFIGPTDHGFTIENRQAMYAFFLKAAGLRGTAEEPPISPIERRDTLVARGNVFTIPGTRNIRDFIAEKADALAAARPKANLPALRRALSRLLAVGRPAVPHYRVLRTIVSGDDYFSRFGLETEPDRVMAVLIRRHPTWIFYIGDEEEVTLYVPEQDARAELAARKAGKGEAVYALDFRSIGEMLPSGTYQDEKRDFFAPCRSDYHYASFTLMLGTPMVGGKVKDILGAVELLAAKGAKTIHLEGRGIGAIPALFAAALSDKVTTLRFIDSIDSYDEELRRHATSLPLSCIVPDILRHTDLPEIRKAIAGKIVDGKRRG